MAKVRIEGQQLVVDVEGLDKVLAFKSRVVVDLAHVRGATFDPEIVHQPKGWRGPGANVPGVVVAGTFHQAGERIFWDVHDGERVVVIELSEEDYDRLVVEVDDPRAVAAAVDAAIHAG